MKRILLAGLCLAVLSTPAWAATAYVSDVMEITLRSGPSTNHKIIAMLRSDQALEIVEEGPDWTRARTQNGKEGWVLSRFLTTQTPNRIRLARLQSEYDDIRAKTEALSTENTQLTAENNRLSAALKESQATIEKLNAAYGTLKKDSADFINLKTRFEKTSAELAKQTGLAEQFEAELSKLRFNERVRWFLSGAGVLLLGMIIGAVLKRQRRRSSLL
jgi:SH3 domain protein